MRVGVFPTHVLVEWRAFGSLPEPYAISWSLDGGRVVLGDELIPAATLPPTTVSWSDLLANASSSPSRSQECHDALQTRVERLSEQLRETAAERDRLTAALAERGPVSALRRTRSQDGIPDAQFVRTIKRG